MTSPHTPPSLVVAEHDGAWAQWTERFGGRSRGAELLRQGAEESATEFAQRVRSRFAALEANGGSPKRVVLVGGGSKDGAVASRSLMIRAIAHAMAKRGGGELLLDSDGSDRFTMQALADTVSDMLRGSGVEVAHAPSTDDSQVRPRPQAPPSRVADVA